MKKETNWFFENRLIFSLFLMLIIGLLLLYKFDSSTVIYEKVLSMIGSILATVSLTVLFFSIPFFHNDISNFAKTIIFDTNFLKHIKSEKLLGLAKLSLKETYAHNRLHDFLDYYLDNINKYEEPYFSKCYHNIEISIEKRKIKKVINKTHDINIHKKMLLKDLIDKYTDNIVWHENNDDLRKITNLEISIARNKSFVHSIKYDETYLKDYVLDEIIKKKNYTKITQLNNTILGDLDFELETNDVVSYTIVEERITGMNSNKIAYRLKHVSRNMHINVSASGGTLSVDGNLYGNDMLKGDFKYTQLSPTSFNIYADKWLLPGSGYLIFINKS